MLEFPLISSVCAVSPHPDDAECGAGGLIRRVVGGGGKVVVMVQFLHTTDSHHKGVVTDEVRMKEFLTSMRVLGAEAGTVLYDTDDVSFAHRVTQVEQSLIDHKPRLVLIPYPSSHQQHTESYMASLAALRPTSKNSPSVVWMYEYPGVVWGSPVHEVGHTYVDITDVFEKKMEALSKYESQLSENGLVSLHSVELLSRKRGIECGVKYAERFTVLRQFLI